MIQEYKVTKPNKPLNSAIFYKETGFNLYEKDNGLYVTGENLTQAKANELLAAHNPEAEAEQSTPIV